MLMIVQRHIADLNPNQMLMIVQRQITDQRHMADLNPNQMLMIVQRQILADLVPSVLPLVDITGGDAGEPIFGGLSVGVQSAAVQAALMTTGPDMVRAGGDPDGR
jgi:hypothetical protein